MQRSIPQPSGLSLQGVQGLLSDRTRHSTSTTSPPSTPALLLRTPTQPGAAQEHKQQENQKAISRVSVFDQQLCPMSMLKPSLVFGTHTLKTCVSSSELLLFHTYSFMAVACIILATVDFQWKGLFRLFT